MATFTGDTSSTSNIVSAYKAWTIRNGGFIEAQLTGTWASADPTAVGLLQIPIAAEGNLQGGRCRVFIRRGAGSYFYCGELLVPKIGRTTAQGNSSGNSSQSTKHHTQANQSEKKMEVPLAAISGMDAGSDNTVDVRIDAMDNTVYRLNGNFRFVYSDA